MLVPNDSPAGARDPAGFDVPATYRREWDFSADGIRRSLEESLERLGLDRIDVLYLHDPDNHWKQAIDEAYPALADLRDQGVVKAIGAGMNQTEMLARFVRHSDMDLLMLAGRFTLLEQPAVAELLPLCAERGVGVVAVGVFNSGLLATPRPPDDAMYNYAPAPADLLDQARQIADLCEKHGTVLPAAALRFPLAHPAVTSVGVGCRSADQVNRNVELFTSGIPDELWSDLVASGLVDPSAVPAAAQ